MRRRAFGELLVGCTEGFDNHRRKEVQEGSFDVLREHTTFTTYLMQSLIAIDIESHVS